MDHFENTSYLNWKKPTLDIIPLGNVLGWKDATSFDEN